MASLSIDLASLQDLLLSARGEDFSLDFYTIDVFECDLFTSVDIDDSDNQLVQLRSVEAGKWQFDFLQLINLSEVSFSLISVSDIYSKLALCIYEHMRILNCFKEDLFYFLLDYYSQLKAYDEVVLSSLIEVFTKNKI